MRSNTLSLQRRGITWGLAQERSCWLDSRYVLMQMLRYFPSQCSDELGTILVAKARVLGIKKFLGLRDGHSE